MRGMINHIDLTVADPDRSLPFYQTVLGFMGYRRVNAHPHGYDFDLVSRGGGYCSIGIMRAQGTGSVRTHDRYSPGLHHLAWTAESRADVDRLHELLLEIGAEVLDAPAPYPKYGDAYYAVFFADPDGLKLEYVHWPKP
jgi:catechol 2,3-dioxygenase-like lactoylglutathione lyase family enzyme